MIALNFSLLANFHLRHISIKIFKADKQSLGFPRSKPTDL